MASETSVKLTFNDDMRRFSFSGTSFEALKAHVVGLFGLNHADVALKYIDEDGDLITMSSDAELRAAIVPAKVLRLQVVCKPTHAQNALGPQPMDMGAVYTPFPSGVPPVAPPPGFAPLPQGAPFVAPFPAHGPNPFAPGPFPPHPHHHAPYPFGKDKHLWHKYKEEAKKAKKNLSKEEWKAFKEAHKQEIIAHKQAKHAWKESVKAAKKAGFHHRGGHHGGHHGHHHGGPHGHHGPHGGPHGHHGGPHGHHGPHHGGPHHGPNHPHHPPPFPQFAPNGGFGFGGFGAFGGGRCGRGEGKLIARHVKDVTVADGTQLPPGTPFVKTWRIRNEGPAWPAGCRLYFVSKHNGDIMGGPEFVVVDNAVETNQEVDLSVNLVAPANPGRYTGYWRLVAPDGRKFGQRVWVSVVVPALGSSSSSSDEEERLADRYELLVDTVLAQGFHAKRHRVFRLLQKCDGDVDKVCSFLAEKVARKAERENRKGC